MLSPVLLSLGARHPYKKWSQPIKASECHGSALVACSLEDGVKTYRFPAGIFEIDEQLLVPENVSICGAASPNDAHDPLKSPDWSRQTLFLATRGATKYSMNYCHASDMVATRVGFVLSSHVSVRNVSYQGIDTIRPSDNGGLCGGGAFETKGCATNDCSSDVNNAASDGVGSVHVTIENVRLNDYYHLEDAVKVGAHVKGNTDCDGGSGCCFCEPNGVRASQVGVWVPQSRNAEGAQHLLIKNVVSRASQADGINLHGRVSNALVQGAYIENTGDDSLALWGATLRPTNVTFRDCVAVNPGVLRPGWYGNCVATYGLLDVVFDNLTCRAPTLAHAIPFPQPGATISRIDTSMFVFYRSFDATYPPDNNITIQGWHFGDLQGRAYTPAMGTLGPPGLSGRMAWTRSVETGVVAPYYFPDAAKSGGVNVHVVAAQRPPLVS